MANKTILVGIASYHDPELPKTIADCLAKAKHQDRVYFAVVNQYDTHTINSLDDFPSEKIKLAQFDHHLTRGVGFARRLMTDLWTGEDFILQIDAHSRFEPDWDELLLKDWQACNDDRAVLTAYPPGYQIASDGAVTLTPYVPTTIFHVSMKGDIPALKASIRPNPNLERWHTTGASGNFQFGPGSVFGVSYISEICFTGEEFVRGLQLYSHGFRLYAPNALPVRHLYNRQGTRFWDDMPARGATEHYNRMTQDSYAFTRALFAGKLPSYHRYFGDRKTIAEYLEYSRTLGSDVSILAALASSKRDII
ncbi:UDP-N-acetylglucosamine-transferase [Candidatus Saccharibacteria bacterium]|nr:UDP-N-acetylglucosamine-transferase [Candidatus Saccharibacteria bacterium]